MSSDNVTITMQVHICLYVNVTLFQGFTLNVNNSMNYSKTSLSALPMRLVKHGRLSGLVH